MSPTLSLHLTKAYLRTQIRRRLQDFVTKKKSGKIPARQKFEWSAVVIKNFLFKCVVSFAKLPQVPRIIQASFERVLNDDIPLPTQIDEMRSFTAGAPSVIVLDPHPNDWPAEDDPEPNDDYLFASNDESESAFHKPVEDMDDLVQHTEGDVIELQKRRQQAMSRGRGRGRGRGKGRGRGRGRDRGRGQADGDDSSSGNDESSSMGMEAYGDDSSSGNDESFSMGMETASQVPSPFGLKMRGKMGWIFGFTFTISTLCSSCKASHIISSIHITLEYTRVQHGYIKWEHVHPQKQWQKNQ